jgi:hypothetical protein
MLAGIGTACLMTVAARVRRYGTHAALCVGLAVATIMFADVYSRSALHFALPVLTGDTRYLPDELIAHLDARRDGRTFIENVGTHYTRELPYLSGTMNALTVVPTYEPLIPAAYAAFFDQGKHWRGFMNVLPYHGPRYFFLVIAEPQQFAVGVMRRLLDLLSVRYYVTKRDLARERIAELEEFVGGSSIDIGPAVVVERPQALPRAYTVHEVVIQPDDERAREILRAPSTDIRHVAVVEREISPLGSTPSEQDDVSLVVSDPERVVLEATCASPCLLVLTDLYYPGWEARVDGDPVAIHRVNTLVRGIRLAAGAHTIEYRYRSRPLVIGLVFAALGVAFITAWSVGRLVRTRSIAHPRSPESPT